MVITSFVRRVVDLLGARGVLLGVAALCVVGQLASCGPIVSTQMISDARRSVDRASSRDGAEHAIYEYTLATLYLDKAREEWAYNRYQKARDYARLAQRYAEEALLRMEQGLGPGEAGQEDGR